MAQNLGLDFIAGTPSSTGLDTIIQVLVTTTLAYYDYLST